MVAAAHPLAVWAGTDALRRGGNAMDAAIAAAFATGVVIPAMNGLGGDAFIIYWDNKAKTLTAINGSGIAPKALSRDYFVSRGYDKMPFVGPLAIAVPGAVGAYFEAIQRFCKLPVADLASSAIHYAEHGFPLSRTGARTIAAGSKGLSEFADSAAVFMPNGEPLQEGQTLRQVNLAKSLKLIVEQGPEVMYEGELGERIAEAISSLGGELQASDFSGHESDVYEPISTTYRDYVVYETAPPSQGLIVLEELNILEQADLAAMGHNSADAIHLMVEAKKRAFADRLAYTRDPRFGHVPLDTLLSKAFAAERFATIDMAQAATRVEPGAIPELDGDTTYLCTADGEGNMVSLITSLSAGWGSGVVAGDTGILLNNRAGRGFSLVEGHPNVIEGGKRTMHTLNPYLIARNGEAILVGGTPGGDQQPQWNMQMITNFIDYGMDVQATVEAPRWQSFPGTDPINIDNDFVLRLEERIGEAVFDELTARNHAVQWLPAFGAGGAAMLIQRDPETGVLQGGSDPRSEGLALGI